MIGHRHEDTPEIDYMEEVQKRLKTFAEIESMSMGSSEKKGAASAKISYTVGTITIDHAGRRLTITTLNGNTETALIRVKDAWRKMRGAPTLKS